MQSLSNRLGLRDSWMHRSGNGLDAYCNAQGGTVAVCCTLGGGIKASRVRFVRGDMIQFAASRALSGADVAVLNMANAHHAGGGFLNGARAQEEQLCHRSTLFVRLKHYAHHGNYPIRHGTCLLTPNVELLFDSNFMETDAATVSVLSAAATSYPSEEEARKDARLSDNLLRTWLSVLAAASASGATEVVVSAIGAGAFHNPPEEVGKAFRNATRRCSPSKIRRLHVVIMEDHNSVHNFERFKSGFESA